MAQISKEFILILQSSKEKLLENLLLCKQLVVIQPADKGSGVCVFAREDYEEEARRQLEDTLEEKQKEIEN